MVYLQPAGEYSLRVSVIMIVLVTIAVPLRIFARSKIGMALAAEDVLIGVAVCLFYIDQGIFLTAVLGSKSAGSSDSTQMTLAQLDSFRKYLYVEEILFTTVITLVKISILTFYQHIFTVKEFRQRARILGAVCVVWFLVCVLIIIFQCRPVPAAWHLEDQQPPGAAKCLQIERAIFGFKISSVFIDAMILSLPVYMVQRLQMKLTKKIGLIGIFLLGGFALVSCAVPAYYIFDPTTGMARELLLPKMRGARLTNHITGGSLPAAMNWTTIELGSAILCACLPTYGPLFSSFDVIPTAIKNWCATLMSSFSTRQRSNNSKRQSSKQGGTAFGGDAYRNVGNLYPYQCFKDPTERQYLTEVRSNPEHQGQTWNENLFEMDNIRVQTTVDVV